MVDPDAPDTLEPLNAFSNDYHSASSDSNDGGSDREDVPHSNGKLARFLTNYAGNVRFFGESNPLSFLQECRAVFYNLQGPSHFVDDPKNGMVHDEPDSVKIPYPVQVPNRLVTQRLVQLYKENINDVFYVFDMAYFDKSIVQVFYRNPLGISPEKLSLLYLVLALGMLYAETSQLVQIEEIVAIDTSYFFDSAILVQRTLEYDGLLWQVESNILIHFYYQGQSKRTLSWLHLGMAIRLAQGLGLHRKVINEKFDTRYNVHRRRLWMTLFICDRISSINLGRPLGINEYEWDDLGTIEHLQDPVENLHFRCQYALSQVCAINGKIVENLYQVGAIRLRGASDLASELKAWSQNLPVDLNLKTTFRKITEPDELSVNYPLVLMHLSQFYGIMLLCKPFFMHVLMRRLQPDSSEVKNLDFYRHFCGAAIKSAFLTINLISTFLDCNPDRLELFTTINSCFFASLILAFTLFHYTRVQNSSREYIAALTSAVTRGKDILYEFGAFNITLERWSENLNNMLRAISDAQEVDSSPGLTEDFNVLKDEIVKMNADEFGRQQESINFQDTFVPTAFAISEDELNDANMENPLLLEIFMHPIFPKE